MHSTLLSLLREILCGTNDITELRKISSVKQWQFNKHIQKLVQDGFVKKEGNRITLQKNVKTFLLRTIAQNWNLEYLLLDSNELVLSCLTELLTVNEILARTGLSAATVHRAISDLKAIGVIEKKIDTKEFSKGKGSKTLRIDPSETSLIVFASILKIEREKIGESNVEILFTDKEKTIKKIPKGEIIIGDHQTSFSLFTDNGMQYDSTHDYYVTQKNPPDIHDIIIHSVLITYKDNDKLALTMTIAFYVQNKHKTDTKQLRKIAKSFDMSSVWLDVEGYVQRQEPKKKNLFLPWCEFLSKAELYEINHKKYTQPKYEPLLFEYIAIHLTNPASMFLTGAENMRLKNLKPTTSDYDVIIENPIDFVALYEILTEKLDYKKLIRTEYSLDDLRLNPDEILIHANRGRIVMFAKKMFNNLPLSDTAINTCDYLEYKKLKIGILRNEHVFLLKAIASRPCDIHDMAKLLHKSSNLPMEFDHGKFNWNMVWQEIIYQEKIHPFNSMTLSIFHQISALAEYTEIAVPILDKLQRHLLDQSVLQLVGEGRQLLGDTVSRLSEENNVSQQMVRNRIDALVKNETIRKYTVGNKAFIASATDTAAAGSLPIKTETI